MEEVGITEKKICFLRPIFVKYGIRIYSRRVYLINCLPISKTLTDVRSYLGLNIFFKLVIKNFYLVSESLTELEEVPGYPEMGF